MRDTLDDNIHQKMGSQTTIAAAFSQRASHSLAHALYPLTSPGHKPEHAAMEPPGQPCAGGPGVGLGGIGVGTEGVGAGVGTGGAGVSAAVAQRLGSEP